MILCCGELLIDFIGSNHEKNTYTGFPGGSPYNTAIAASRLGAPTGFFSRISTDMFGVQLKEYLEKQGVNLAYACFSPDPTILSFIKMGADGKPQYAFFPHGCADRMMQVSDLPLPLPPEVQAVLIGSISLILEPGASTIVEFISQIHQNTVISFDPNIRASLIPDQNAYVNRFETLAGWSDVVKLSDEDLNWLYPNLTWQEGMDRLLNLGTALVALTRGAEGAVLRTKTAEVTQPVVSFGLEDTVGAGDTFHGALMAFLHKNGLLEKTLIHSLSEDMLSAGAAFAAKAAGLNCSRKGADPPDLEEMKWADSQVS